MPLRFKVFEAREGQIIHLSPDPLRGEPRLPLAFDLCFRNVGLLAAWTFQPPLASKDSEGRQFARGRDARQRTEQSMSRKGTTSWTTPRINIQVQPTHSRRRACGQ